MSKKSVAGMSLGGGRRENFFFCLLEYYEDNDRWFLTSLHQVKDEQTPDKNAAIMSWVDNYDLKQLVVDFPLTSPACETCKLDCPGTENCEHPIVSQVRSEIHDLLNEDLYLSESNPKRYEQERVEHNKVHFNKSVLDKETSEHLLSKSFKRRLKKGYLPYWNRPVDFWVWKNYYDQILGLYNISYDSFGNVSTMLMKRFEYLKRHLPSDLRLVESYVPLIMIELYRSHIINKKQILESMDLNVAVLARMQIVKDIEKNLGIFIYEKDLEMIVKNTKAFDSFILAVAGRSVVMGKLFDIPKFEEAESFVAPIF